VRSRKHAETPILPEGYISTRPRCPDITNNGRPGRPNPSFATTTSVRGHPARFDASMIESIKLIVGVPCRVSVRYSAAVCGYLPCSVRNDSTLIARSLAEVMTRRPLRLCHHKASGSTKTATKIMPPTSAATNSPQKMFQSRTFPVHLLMAIWASSLPAMRIVVVNHLFVSTPRTSVGSKRP